MRYECHAHIALDSVDWKRALECHKNGPDERLVRERLQAYRKAGVGYVRDGGDNLGVSLLAAKIAPEYGIEFRSPAFAIHRKGRYGSMVGKAFGTLAEYRGLVAEVKALGGDYIKIMATGILDFDVYGSLSSQPLDPDELAEMVKIAHGEGFSVMAHCNGADPIKAAVAAGVDSIEHGFYPDTRALEDLAQSNTVLVPTIAPLANLIGTGSFSDAVLKRVVEEHRVEAARLIDMGGMVAPGSDAGASGVAHGRGAKDEYGYLKGWVPEGRLQEGAHMIRVRFQRF